MELSIITDDSFITLDSASIHNLKQLKLLYVASFPSNCNRILGAAEGSHVEMTLTTGAVRSCPQLDTVYVLCASLTYIRNTNADRITMAHNAISPGSQSFSISMTAVAVSLHSDFVGDSRALRKLQFFGQGGTQSIQLDDVSFVRKLSENTKVIVREFDTAMAMLHVAHSVCSYDMHVKDSTDFDHVAVSFRDALMLLQKVETNRVTFNMMRISTVEGMRIVNRIFPFLLSP